MAERNFFKIGEKRRKLRHEVLDTTGVSAADAATRGVVTEEEFRKAVEEGKLSDLAERVILPSAEVDATSEALEEISKLNEEASEFKFIPARQVDELGETGSDASARGSAYTERTDISDARKRYAGTRMKASFTNASSETHIEHGVSPLELEADPKRIRIFAELDAAKRFSELAKRGRYRLLRRPEDDRLAERLRRGAKLNTLVEARVKRIETDPDTRFLVREYRLAEIRRQSFHPDKTGIVPLRRGADFLGKIHFPTHRILRTKTARRALGRLSRENAASYIGLTRHVRAHGLADRMHGILKKNGR